MVKVMKADILHGSDKTEKMGKHSIHHGDTAKRKIVFTTETRRRGDNKAIAGIAETYLGFTRMIADHEGANF
jgi:hypothetical protein